MAQDVEQLVLTISADVRQMQRALNRMVGESASSTKRVQAHFDKMGRDIDRSIARSFGGIGRTIRGGLAAFGVGASFQGASALVDSATRITNALKVAGLEGERLEAVYQRLFVSAQRNSAPLETLVTLYGRAATVQKELGVSTEELLGFTDKVALALRVAGTDAQSATGALLQLSQALGSGVVRAEEFNSILEGALPIAQAAAAGLKEAGGSVAELRKLVIDGRVSSEAFFRAFEAGSAVLEDKVAGSQKTVGQAITTLFNALTDVAGEFDRATGASGKFAGGIESVAQAIADFDVSGFIAEIDRAISAVRDLGNQPLFRDIVSGKAPLPFDIPPVNLDVLEAEEKAAALEKEVERLQETIAKNTELGFDNSEALERLGEVRAALAAVRAEAAAIAATPAYVPGTPGDPNALASRSTAVPVSRTVAPVSLNDFAPPATRGGGRRGGGGGGRERSDYARETEQIRERTAAILAETEALAGLNPLIDDYGYTMARARAEQELLNAANEDGREITPQLRAEIEGLADAYATAEAAAEKLAEKQDQIREAATFFADTFGEAILDLIPAIETGNAALDKLLNTLVEAVAQAALLGNGPLAGLFGGIGGGGGGILGLLGGLFGFAGGGYTGNGMRNDPAGIVHRGEYVFDQASVRAAGGPRALDAMRRGLRGYADGGYVGAAPMLPRLPAVRGGTSRDVVDIRLYDDSGRMAEIADQQIETRSGTIVRVAVQQSQKQTRRQFPALLADTQLRDL